MTDTALPQRLADASAELSLPDHRLAELLKRLDAFAVDSVRSGRGGPFGAELLVHDATTDQLISLSGPRGNAVLAKGIASAHAESEALTPDCAAQALTILRERPTHQLHLIQASSAESCPACRAKQMVFLAHLQAQGWPTGTLLQVTFGASYEETEAVAGFNDKIYHDDLLGLLDPPLLRVTKALSADLPQDVLSALASAEAVLAFPDPADATRRLILAEAQARLSDPLQPSAIRLLHRASALRRDAGSETPWTLGADGPARLYLSGGPVGPLTYTDAQWAGISEICCVTDLPPAAQEVPQIDNAALMARARLPYNADGTPLQVRQLRTGTHGLTNTAQQIWRDEVLSRDPSRLYNGI